MTKTEAEENGMPSSKDYLLFLLDQLSDLDDISYRAMMGEYIIGLCHRRVSYSKKTDGWI